jgi:hypothetical protein
MLADGCARDAIPLERSSLQPTLGAIRERLIDSLDHIGDVAVADGAVVLTDVGAHRLLQFDPQGRARLQGRRGRGPGEFAFLLFVDARGGRVVVDDQGNGRFQQFDRTGVLQRVFNAPVPVRHFAIESDSTILVALADSTWYLARVFADGRWEPLARRPVPTASPTARGDHLVAMTGERTVAIFDQDRALLLLYGADGKAVTRTALPDSVAAMLGASSAEQQHVLWRRFGQVLSAPVIKDLAGDGAGHLLLLFSARREAPPDPPGCATRGARVGGLLRRAIRPCSRCRSRRRKRRPLHGTRIATRTSRHPRGQISPGSAVWPIQPTPNPEEPN